METLTPRERDILHHVVSGMTAPQIAVQLHLSTETVREYIARIYRKLGVHSRAECTVVAIQQRLINI